ncbi:MAG: nitroreductase family protein [Acholeplasmataceae bacterium]
MSFQQLVEKRESCRSFNEKPVEIKHLEALIETARLAPSACNGQPWHFTVITKKEVLKDVSSSMQAFNEKAGALIVITEDDTKVIARAGEIVKDQCYRSIDIGIATAFITLKATELGLSSCIIGWFNETKVKKTLGIPKRKRIRLIISLGYTDTKDVRVKKRKDLKDIVTYIKE